MNKRICEAIYTRQSVDKADSISVESQLEFCEKELIGKSVKIYTDKGYSGKDMERPSFQKMMRDIEQGKINRVIVYRLDRISRSVLDFSTLIEFFQKYQVEFVSTMEKFDTATPIGKAMLMIVMIFAQLERETIQKRIADAYSSRSRRGFYMGGAVPYGYSLKDTVIDGVRTKMYEINEAEAQVIKLIFSRYKEPQTSFGDVVKELDELGVKKRDGKAFGRCRIRDIVINPSYVKADYSIYEFFKNNGTIIENDPEEFIGTNGAYLYSGDRKKRKTVSLEGHVLVLAPHMGIVDSKTWLCCREKCMNNHQVSKPLKARQSWLAGKIKCEYCGYALLAKSYSRKNAEPKRYFLCNGKHSSRTCCFRSLNADEAEDIVFSEIEKKLEEFPVIEERENGYADREIIKLKKSIESINDEINLLIEKLIKANEASEQYINRRISSLDCEKQELYRKITKRNKEQENKSGGIKDYINLWNKLSIEDKRTVVDCVIESIHASENEIMIKWKI